MDRTGSASRYEISSSGAHTIKGNATANGDFNVVNNGTSTNILTALNNKRNLVNPTVDIPNWLQLQSDYFYYFSDPVAPILRLKTDNIAPKANPAFTGNASVEGNLTIGGTFKIGETFQIDPNTGIPQAMVNGLTSALSAKQTSLTFSVPPANGFSLLNNSTVRGLVYDSPITLAVDGNENLHVGLDQSNLQPKLTFSSPPANGLSLLSGSTVRGIAPAAPITLEVNGYDNIQVGLDQSNIAPKANPAFTGNASVVGNLAISGELSVDKIKLHSTTPGSRIEFPDGVLFSNNVSLAGNRLLATNAIAPSSGSDAIFKEILSLPGVLRSQIQIRV